MEFAVGHHFFECDAGDVGVGGLGFVYGDTGHARQHGLAGVTVEAGAGGDEFAVYADAGALGVALFAGSGAISQLWLFWLAPLVGGVIGGGLYAWLRPAND